MKKRILSLALVLCFVCAAMCIPVQAAETDSTHLFHTPALQNNKSATETEAGYTGDLVCSECKEVLIEGKEIPATGSEDAEEEEHRHSIEIVNAKSATYLEPGYTGDTVCSDCGEVLRAGEEIPATGSYSHLLPNPFLDVAPSAYYYNSVLWAYYGGITTGTDSTHFDPDGTCTRGQIVTFLWRAAGSPEPEWEVNPFTDVTEDTYYYKAILWAVANGVTEGYGSADIFNPDGTCTRAQAVTFLWRYLDKPAAEGENPFTDVDDADYFYTAVLWAVENGVTNGYGAADVFNPDGLCARCEIVSFLYRALN